MSAVIDPLLLDLVTLLRCLTCGRTDFAAAPDALTCRGCGATVPVQNGVPFVKSANENPAIAREREAVREIEALARNTPNAFSVEDLWRDGPLFDAFVSLPYDNGSPLFRDHEYFRNVSRFADVFDYVMAVVGPSSGGRVLDVGADLTWSTARLAAAGWRAVGIDINDHLFASHVLRRHGPSYAVVNMDMHLPAWRDGAFDMITAFNALHHTHQVEALIRTLTAARG